MRFQARQHLRRVKIALDQRDRIGEIASGAAMCRVQHDRRGFEQAEFLIQPRNSGFDDARRTAKSAVRPVRSDGDGVEVGRRCQRLVRPERSAKRAVEGR